MESASLMRCIERHYHKCDNEPCAGLAPCDAYRQLSDANLLYKGEPVLHLAARYADCDGVQALLDSSANVNVLTTDGRTALDSLVYGAGSEQEKAEYAVLYTAVALLGAGVDTESRQHIPGYTTAHLAAAQGVYEVFVALINSGCNLETCTPQGDTPLHIACKSALQAGRSLWRHNRNSGCPLEATKQNTGLAAGAVAVQAEILRRKKRLVMFYETVRLLLMYGLDPHQENRAGITPRDMVKDSEDVVLIRFVVDRQLTMPTIYA